MRVGHGDPRWVEAVCEQAHLLTHTSNLFHTVPQVSSAPFYQNSVRRHATQEEVLRLCGDDHGMPLESDHIEQQGDYSLLNHGIHCPNRGTHKCALDVKQETVWCL